jgi:hypothetical protein
LIAASAAAARTSRRASASARAILSSASFMRRSKCSRMARRVSGGEDLGFLGRPRSTIAFGLLGHVSLFALVVCEHLGGLFAQAPWHLRARLAMAAARAVEAGGELLVHAEIKHAAHEQEERYRDPEFRRRR